MKAPNLNNFGKKLKLNKRSDKKQPQVTEKELFIESINMLNDCWNRSNAAYEAFKINLLEYEENYFQIIENFILIKYGAWKAEIMLWYIFAREDDEGNIAPLLIQSKGKEDEEVILQNPEELWNLLERLNNESDLNIE
jgi:hypothetical protein